MSDSYRPSGRFNAVRMAVILPFAVCLALAVGFAEMLIFHAGFYVIGLVPIVAGLLTAGGVYLLASVGHCRNRLVGGLLGLALGLLMHASYFHFDFLKTFQMWGNAHRVDVLPRWVHFRVLTDEQKKVGAADKPNAVGMGEQDGVKLAFKWVFFGMDALCAVIPPLAVGLSVSGRPFSERHRRWLDSQTKPADLDAGRDLVAALLSDDPLAAAGLFRPPPANPDVQMNLVVDYLTHEPDSPVYLSVTEVTNPGNPQRSKVKKSFTRRRLSPEAAAVLARELDLPNAAFAPPADDGHVRAGDKAESDRPAGLVTRLPDGESGQILSKAFITRAVAVQVSPLVVGLAGAAGFGTLAGVYWDDWGLIEKVGLIGLAVVFPVVAIVYLLRHEHYLPAVMHRNRAVAIIGNRPDAVVDAADPDARFVEHVPRANWNKMMVTNAVDSGLLRVDARRRAVLFEGDNERWVLPAESVTSAELAEFCDNHMEKNTFSTFYAVVLTANVGGRVWEAPICPRPVRFSKWNGPDRKVEAERLLADIADGLGLDEREGV